MATHSTVLALKIPWTEHPSGLVLMVKNPPPNAGDIRDSGWISGLGESPGGWQPPPVFLPGKSRGQKNLVDYGLYDL